MRIFEGTVRLWLTFSTQLRPRSRPHPASCNSPSYRVSMNVGKSASLSSLMDLHCSANSNTRSTQPSTCTGTKQGGTNPASPFPRAKLVKTSRSKAWRTYIQSLMPLRHSLKTMASSSFSIAELFPTLKNLSSWNKKNRSSQLLKSCLASPAAPVQKSSLVNAP